MEKKYVVYTVLFLVFILLTLNVQISKCDSEVIWNATGVFVKVPKLETGINFEGVVVNVYYINESCVKLVAYNITNDAPYTSAVFKLYNYWNGSLIGEYSVSGVKEVTVNTNMTIVYIYLGSNELGPYYVTTLPPLVSVPESVKPVITLFPLALLISLSARGSMKDLALGLIAYSFINQLITKVFGITEITYTALISALCFISGLVILLAYYERR